MARIASVHAYLYNNWVHPMPLPFHPIARLLTSTLRPPPRVDLNALQAFLQDRAHMDQGALITANHYYAPDFHAWWYVIIISAVLPLKIRWIVTSGWTNSGWLDGFTHWLFPLGSKLLNFTPMPAMPPNPLETEQRAIAVRDVLNYSKLEPKPVIGLTPEGRDIPGGVLGELPPGVGRFMHLISRYCPQILPVGVWKEDGIIHVKFGNPYRLDVPDGMTAEERDKWVGETVMRRIAVLLPERLRGIYT